MPQELRDSADDTGVRTRDRGRMSRILVAYGSKHGSTAEIAEAIAATLREAGLEVDCVKAGDVHSLDGYGAVVLGSAVYMRRWRRAARRFLDRFAGDLRERPLWVFSSGPVGDPDHINYDWAEPPRTIERADRLGAREHVVFGGRSESTRIPEEHRDLRDWDEIREWARRIAAEVAVVA
jgi:menaquinone-dependent protoporphyrinogen oxidase